ANLIEDPQASAYGVLFDVGDDELAHIELTEGVLIENYRRVIVPVELLAKTDAQVVHAFSLSSDKRDPTGRPTVRYMSLLIEGAIEHRLPAEHVEFLRGVPTCEETSESLQMRDAIDGFMRRGAK
ncbi:MAG TPA: gamma-glutamylcyclotransferase, partial [Candidatus Acidoferrales bacterium]|nr:gamma-glutamylcyclotransferase [Candidatus Acidoferrales bacterium]